MDERIERALERLELSRVVIDPIVVPRMGTTGTDICKPLAALIRRNANPLYCSCRAVKASKPMGQYYVHARDCALIALCEAVAGEAGREGAGG